VGGEVTKRGGWGRGTWTDVGIERAAVAISFPTPGWSTLLQDACRPVAGENPLRYFLGRFCSSPPPRVPGSPASAGAPSRPALRRCPPALRRLRPASFLSCHPRSSEAAPVRAPRGEGSGCPAEAWLPRAAASLGAPAAPPDTPGWGRTIDESTNQQRGVVRFSSGGRTTTEVAPRRPALLLCGLRSR